MRIVITNLDSEEAQHIARNILLNFTWIGKENIRIEKDYDVIPVFILACIIGLTEKEKEAIA